MGTAVYYRVSTDKQDFKSQRHAVEQWLHERDLLASVYTDEGLSGNSLDRPGFQQLLSDCKAGLVDTVVCYKLDRFSRDASAAIRLILELDALGVAFVSVTQPILNLGHENPFRRTMIAAFAEIAEIERQTIVERVKSGLKSARERGIQLGAPVTIDPEQRALVAQLRAAGRSIRAIASAAGISSASVSRILRGVQ